MCWKVMIIKSRNFYNYLNKVLTVIVKKIDRNVKPVIYYVLKSHDYKITEFL